MKDRFDCLRLRTQGWKELQSSASGVEVGVEGRGTDTTHECRNYVAVYDWTTSQRAIGSGDIL